MKKCREYRIRVSSFPATYAPLICMKLTILPPLCLSFQPILSSSSSSSSIVHVRLESKPPPSLPTSRPHFLFVLGGRKQKEGGVKKCGRKGFPLAAALESTRRFGLTTRPAIRVEDYLICYVLLTNRKHLAVERDGAGRSTLGRYPLW